MQNRYTGDIGDFSKLGLLRALHATGLSIGLNWYLTPDETHNNDGGHTKYLTQEEFLRCDRPLALELKGILDNGKREVHLLESDDILEATFFSECLDFTGMRKAERAEFRKAWYGRSLAKLSGRNVVLVDPDNGLVVRTAAGRPKENKYVLPEELAGNYARGSSVIYYQHKARRKDEFYARQHRELVHGSLFPGAEGLALKFRPTSQRYYLFVIQPRHKSIIKAAVDEMLSTSWGEHFSLLREGDWAPSGVE